MESPGDNTSDTEMGAGAGNKASEDDGESSDVSIVSEEPCGAAQLDGMGGICLVIEISASTLSMAHH